MFESCFCHMLPFHLFGAQTLDLLGRTSLSHFPARMAEAPMTISVWFINFDLAQGWLTKQILREARTELTKANRMDQYGTRYTVEVPVRGPSGAGTVITGWTIKEVGAPPALATAFAK